jgi:hypothetical protein
MEDGMVLKRLLASQHARTAALVDGNLVDISEIASESGVPLSAAITTNLNKRLTKVAGKAVLRSLLLHFGFKFIVALAGDFVDRISSRYFGEDIVMHIIVGSEDADCGFIFDSARKANMV